MLKNYLKMAFRNILKQRGYSVINIIGLAVGITCMALAFLYAQYEFSFDRFHKGANRIYRVCSESSGAVSPAEIAPTMLDRFPEVESATRLMFGSYDNNRVLFHYRDKSLYSSGYYADQQFFKIFSFPFLKGNPQTALAEPNTIVITEDFAQKYFGDEDPLGALVNFDKKYDLKVTGLIENIPPNSHLQFDFLVSFATYAAMPSGKSFSECWACSGFLTYIKLRDNAEVVPLENKLADLMKEKAGGTSDHFLQPLTNIRLYSNLSYEPSTLSVSDIYYVYLTLSIAGLILLLGCLNYINIATSIATSRANEIGIRKMVGADKIHLVFQYIVESLAIILIAALGSLILIELILPFVNSYANLRIGTDYLDNYYFLLFIILLCLIVSLIAGGIPALALSSINPLRVINKLYSAGKGSIGLRRLFVIIQFGLAICLLAITLIINSQLNYVNKKDVGYDKKNIVVIKMKGDDFEKNRQNIKTEILRHSNVTGATYSSHLPNAIKNSTANRVDENGDSTNLVVYFCEVDEDFTEVYGIDFINGRNYSRDFNDTRKSSVIVNESAAKAFGLESPIGSRLGMFGDNDAEIIGVMRDFNFLSLHKSIAPMVLLYGDGSYLSARIQGDNIHSTIGYIEDVVKRFIPDYPFEYKMFADYYQKAYATENNLNVAFNIFAAIAIFVACLGLVGLSSFAAEQKSKEISIRKVLGATVLDIVKMLTSEFVILVVIANLIAWPIAWYIMRRWLENFVYRIDIGISSFMLAGLAAVLIALITVSYHALRAALTNPVKGIRHE
jgi:putative ABC transport system permease protein